MRDVAAYLASSNARHARRDRLFDTGSSRRRVPLAELGGAIAADNTARAERSRDEEERSAARAEILLACESVAETCEAHAAAHPALSGLFEGLELFRAAVREYLLAEAAKSAPRRGDAIAAMRAAVASLERTRGQGGEER